MHDVYAVRLSGVANGYSLIPIARARPERESYSGGMNHSDCAKFSIAAENLHIEQISVWLIRAARFRMCHVVTKVLTGLIFVVVVGVLCGDVSTGFHQIQKHFVNEEVLFLNDEGATSRARVEVLTRV